jgi:hypothetical protein
MRLVTDRRALVLSATIKNADVVAWACFVVGMLVLLVGVVIGLILSFRKPQPGSTDRVGGFRPVQIEE